jgi:hypothetical protein
MSLKSASDFQSRRLPGKPTLWLLAVALAYAIYQIQLLPPTPILEPDSESYLTFNPSRTAGYPVFLSLVGPEGAIILQPILYAGALAFLGSMAVRAGLGFFMSLALMILAMANREMNQYHGEIMTESLFMSLLVMLSGMAIRFFGLPNGRWAAAASLMAGLAAAVRPSGYAFFPILALMVLMVRQRTPTALWKLLAAALIPMMLVIGVERWYAMHRHGPRATSLLGTHLFAKAGMIDAPPHATTEIDPWRERLLDALEEDFAPIRKLLREAPNSGIRTAMLSDYETCLEYSCIDPLRKTLRTDADLLPSAINSLLSNVGLQRIKSAPFEYMALSWMHYRRMWSEFFRYNPMFFQGYRDYIAAHRPLPFEEYVPALIPEQPRNSNEIFAYRPPHWRPMMIGGLVSGMAFLGLVFTWQGRLPSPSAGIAALSGLTVHSLVILTALVGVGIPRYMTVLWPALMISLVFAIRWVFEPGLIPLPSKVGRRLGFPPHTHERTAGG